MTTEKDSRQVELAGELTVFNALAIQDQLLHALEEAGNLDVDLSRVTEIDTAGVQLILAARREAETRNKAIRFSGSSDAVVDVMALLGFSSHLADAMAAQASA